MQIAVIEYARDVLGLADANSSEFAPDSAHKVIDLMPDQHGNLPKGGTMRLGAYPCNIAPGTLMERAYRSAQIGERHRHRYEFNNEYRRQLAEAGLVISGASPGRQTGGGSGRARQPLFCRRAISPGVQKPTPPGASAVPRVHRSQPGEKRRDAGGKKLR